jgi:hypothetical protein
MQPDREFVYGLICGVLIALPLWMGIAWLLT